LRKSEKFKKKVINCQRTANNAAEAATTGVGAERNNVIAKSKQ
jgi:hypothetical protein